MTSISFKSLPRFVSYTFDFIGVVPGGDVVQVVVRSWGQDADDSIGVGFGQLTRQRVGGSQNSGNGFHLGDLTSLG